MIQGALFEMQDGKSIKNLSAPIVFNTGYQGKTLQEFISNLKKFKVNLIVDLRSKPYSKNVDFIKERLSRELKNHGIDYIWRGKELGGFNVSRETWKANLGEIEILSGTHKVCLMCMEANVNQCHRNQLVELLEKEYSLQTLSI